MVIYVNFNLLFWVYHPMVHDEVTFYGFQRQEVRVKTHGSIKKDYIF